MIIQLHKEVLFQMASAVSIDIYICHCIADHNLKQ